MSDHIPRTTQQIGLYPRSSSGWVAQPQMQVDSAPEANNTIGSFAPDGSTHNLLGQRWPHYITGHPNDLAFLGTPVSISMVMHNYAFLPSTLQPSQHIAGHTDGDLKATAQGLTDIQRRPHSYFDLEITPAEPSVYHLARPGVDEASFAISPAALTDAAINGMTSGELIARIRRNDFSATLGLHHKALIPHEKLATVLRNINQKTVHHRQLPGVWDLVLPVQGITVSQQDHAANRLAFSNDNVFTGATLNGNQLTRYPEALGTGRDEEVWAQHFSIDNFADFFQSRYPFAESFPQATYTLRCFNPVVFQMGWGVSHATK